MRLSVIIKALTFTAPPSELKFFFLHAVLSKIIFNLLPAAFVPVVTQGSTVRRTLITVSAISALNMVFAWTSSTTSPAAARLDLRGRSVKWKRMNATASPAQVVPPVWT